jgi:hypothetical protein
MPPNLFLVFGSLFRSAPLYDRVIDDPNTVTSQPIFPLLLITDPLVIPKKSFLFECLGERGEPRSLGMLSG